MSTDPDPGPLTPEERRQLDDLCDLWDWVMTLRWWLVEEATAPDMGPVEWPDSAQRHAKQEARRRLAVFERQLLAHLGRKSPPWELRKAWAQIGDTGYVESGRLLALAADIAIESSAALLLAHHDAGTDSRAFRSSAEVAALSLNQLRVLHATVNDGQSPAGISESELLTALEDDDVVARLEGRDNDGGRIKAAQEFVAKLGPLSFGQLARLRSQSLARDRVRRDYSRSAPDDDDDGA